MVNWFNTWSKGIVGAVIIATLMEMIIPNNNSKKYIKILLGIFIVYTIISPIIDFFSKENINEYIDFDKYIETSSNTISDEKKEVNSNYNAVQNIYIKEIQNDIRAKLKTKGYIADEINVQISEDGSYNIELIKINISEKSETNNENNVRSIIDNIKAVVINIEGGNEQNQIIDDNDKRIIKQYLNSQYNVGEEKIQVS
ncbi:MAG: stage III sporulation protein AF [Clostridia bacterium]|nr:stage III sporulation protein AF [Clostridia bacterium]